DLLFKSYFLIRKYSVMIEVQLAGIVTTRDLFPFPVKRTFVGKDGVANVMSFKVMSQSSCARAPVANIPPAS
ncbi:hypothetical protein, partial [Paenibacillus chungangensis]